MNRNLATASRIGAGAAVVSLCLLGSAAAGSSVAQIQNARDRATAAQQQQTQPQLPQQSSPGTSQAPQAQPSTGTVTPTSRTAIKANAAQSKGVVLISTLLTGNNEAAGTGMILTSAGQVLTSYHVVEGSEKIQVTVASTGKEYTATVVGHDKTHDVALLQIQNAGTLDTVVLDKQGAAINQSVTAVGNANGQGYLTAVSGQVRDLDQSITASSDGGSSPSRKLTGLIETSAAVVPGDSGGPMYDTQGEVIGINTAASQSGPADSYAVPITQALSIVTTIRAGQDSGTVQVGPSGFLGVALSQQQAGKGAVVSKAISGYAAAKIGITAGSRITAVDGAAITTATSLSQQMSDREPGEQVKITWVTPSGATKTATATLSPSPVN